MSDPVRWVIFLLVLAGAARAWALQLRFLRENARVSRRLALQESIARLERECGIGEAS